MKREIYCADCDNRKPVSMSMSKIIDTPNGRIVTVPFPIEHVKKVRGESTRHLLCDLCYGEIKPGDTIVAVSTWIDGQEYFEWESDYVT